METYTENIARKLNALMEKNRNAEKSFAKAADNAKAKSLATWFNDRSLERKMFNEDLKNEVSSFGQDFDESDSLTDDLHRSWMDLKGLFSANSSDEVMVKEALTGEKAVLDEYSEILDEMSLPRSTVSLLSDQQANIKRGLEVLRTLDNLEFQEE